MALFCRSLSFLRHIPHNTAISTYNNTCRSISRWVAPTLRALESRRKKVGPRPPEPRSGYLEWNYNAEIYAFSKRLGEEFDESLLKQAFTQRSFIIKKEIAGEPIDVNDNSELINAGMQFITNCIKEKYQVKYLPDIVDAVEGYLTSQTMLSHVAFHMGAKELILSSEYPPETSTLANTFIAIVGALKASSGDKQAKKFVDDFLICQLNGKELFDIWDLKDPYQYFTHLLKDKNVEARLCNKSASNTILANYQVGLYSNDKKLLGIGWGETIDIAKDCAAMDAILRLQDVKQFY